MSIDRVKCYYCPKLDFFMNHRILEWKRKISILRFCLCNWQTRQAWCLEFREMAGRREDLWVMLSWYRVPASTRPWTWALRGRSPHSGWDMGSGVERTVLNLSSVPRYTTGEKSRVSAVEVFLFTALEILGFSDLLIACLCWVHCAPGLGLPWWLNSKEFACQCRDTRSLNWEDPLEKETETHFRILGCEIP